MCFCSPAPAGQSNSRGVTQAAPKKNGVRNGGAGGPMRAKDDECFGDGTDEDLDTDFDFEGNLALFDKAAVFSQIEGTNNHSNRTQHHSTQGEQKPVSYRHDENILQGKPVIFRRITVPQHGGKEYCTGEDKIHGHTQTNTHSSVGALFIYLGSLMLLQISWFSLSVIMAATNLPGIFKTANLGWRLNHVVF